MKLVVSAVVVALLSVVSLGKVVTCSPDLTVNLSNRWAFCTKMAFAKDSIANVKAKVAFTDGRQISKPKFVQLFVFKEDQWDTITRNEVLAESRVTCQKVEHLAEFRDLVYFSNDDEEERVIEFSNKVELRSQVWYFVIGDCRKLTFERTQGGLGV